MLYSLITCFYNSSRRLPDYFAALRRLRVAPGDVEFVFVDNASTDDTAARLREMSAGLGGAVTLLSEARPGLMHARCRGIAAARGEYVLFLDDDTEPAPDYFEQLGRIMKQHPRAIFVTGNSVMPDEYRPPITDPRVLLVLTVRHLTGEFAYELDSFYSPHFPWGAGLFARTTDLAAACAAWAAGDCGILGRTGTSLTGGEDVWLVHWLTRTNRTIVFSDQLLLVHRFDPKRLTSDHLARLARENGEQEIQLMDAIAYLKPDLPLHRASAVRTLLWRLPLRLAAHALWGDGNSFVRAHLALGAAAYWVKQRLTLRSGGVPRRLKTETVV